MLGELGFGCGLASATSTGGWGRRNYRIWSGCLGGGFAGCFGSGRISLGQYLAGDLFHQCWVVP